MKLKICALFSTSFFSSEPLLIDIVDFEFLIVSKISNKLFVKKSKLLDNFQISNFRFFAWNSNIYVYVKESRKNLKKSFGSDYYNFYV